MAVHELFIDGYIPTDAERESVTAAVHSGLAILNALHVDMRPSYIESMVLSYVMRYENPYLVITDMVRTIAIGIADTQQHLLGEEDSTDAQ